MTSEFRFYAGIDWASEEHQVCLIDPDCKILEERIIQHSGAGLAQLIQWFDNLSGGNPATIGVGIEVPRGAVVESLVERNFAVFSLNPKQMDRFRDRHSVAGAKDDRRDAFVLADSLRTDQHCFHRVRLDEPPIIRIRELSRLDDELRGEFNRLTNRLREQLNRYFPQTLQLGGKVDEPWLWSLLETAPEPALARRLTVAQLTKLLRTHRIRRVEPAELRTALQAPAFHLAPGTVQAASEHVLLLLPRLRLVRQQRGEVSRRMQEVLDELSAGSEHRDVPLLQSLPGVGRVVTSTMLAEAWQPLAERDYHALRSYAGSAPITRRSGKKTIVQMRQGCNTRLRDALYHWARVSIQTDSHSRAHYAALRRKGHSHGRALRGVADRWLAVLVAMLRTGVPYDPSRRGLAPGEETGGGQF